MKGNQRRRRGDHQLHIAMTPDFKARLKVAAEATGLTMGQYMRMATTVAMNKGLRVDEV